LYVRKHNVTKIIKFSNDKINFLKVYETNAENNATLMCKEWYERPPLRLVVGRSGFGSLVESDQKTLKVGIHSFPA